MTPHRKPRSLAENDFPDFGQFGEAIANTIQSSLCPAPRNTLDIVSRLKINDFFGNEGSEKSEIWFDHVEKTFRVIHRQGNLPLERWVETMTWFFRLGAESWWDHERKSLSDEDAINWDVFKRIFQTRFVPLEYLDSKKNEFTDLRQGKMSATEYHRRFTDLSRYYLETAANPRDMFRLNVQRYSNIGQSSLGLRRAQNFKKSRNSSGSSNGGSNSGTPQRGGRLTGGSHFQNQGNSSNLGVQFCHKCNTRHYGECKRGSKGCFTCEHTGHMAYNYPQNQGNQPTN
ncbi:unnamed protein product [Malus baccata var. baccata]